MNEQQANTVSVTVYTPGGLRAYIAFALPMTASELDSKVAELGFLVNAPGVEAGEVVESILYVCRYDHFDKKDNRDVPHIAFYSESEWLTKRWLHVYLDKPEDVEAFENATGITVANMPVWGGETHPERNNPKAQKFIVRLAKPIRIARESYTNKEGEIRHKLKRYVDTIGSSKPKAAQPSQPASGSADGKQGSGKQGEPVDQNRIQAPDENTWKRWVFEATKFLYTVDGNYNDYQQRESLKKRMADTGDYGINPTMTLYEVLSRLIRYRALHDLFIDTGDYQNIFAMPFDFYYEKHGALPTWQRMNEYYIANTQPAKTKAG